MPLNVNDVITPHLPQLRRYARALTGSQASGDSYAAAALVAIMENPQTLDMNLGPRVGLFRVMNDIWHSSSERAQMPTPDMSGLPAQQHLANLTVEAREALLLATVEEFSAGEVGQILRLSEQDAETTITKALSGIADSLSGRVLIIEDEAAIALDLQNILAELGHKITGVASTQGEAVTLGLAERPDLIMADIRLADETSGIAAVDELLTKVGEIPAIFVTSFPEQLLTGERPEPAFMVSKPYTEAQIRAVVTQAMFFSGNTKAISPVN